MSLCSHNNGAVVPPTFPRFRQLPAELRIKIWHHALPAPRTIHLVRDVSVDRQRLWLGFEAHCKATFPCPKIISNLLHVCRESRREVLSRYQALFNPTSVDDRLFHIHYFDPLKDGIFVDNIWPWGQGESSKPSGIFNARHLSIPCNTWWDMWTRDSCNLFGKGGLLSFNHLEELHIVFRILADHEKELLRMAAPWGQRLSPATLSIFFRRSCDIDFPNTNVDIHVESIYAKFAAMKAANPGWKVPKVKLMAWASQYSTSHRPKTFH
jgi:hypothetical protein